MRCLVRDTEIPLPAEVDCAVVERIVDEVLEQAGLKVTLRGSLKKFPGCIHWHVKNGRESGTLEITVWPQQLRAWFTVQSGRTAPWISAEIKRLANLLQQLLGNAGPTATD